MFSKHLNPIMMNVKYLPISFILLLAATAVRAENPHYSPDLDSATFRRLLLTESDFPEGCHSSTENFTRSIQARTMYDRPGMYAALIGNVEEKLMQSITGPDGDNGTILYFRFAGPVQSESFITSLIWGEEGPTEKHPERIIIKDNVMVILSFDHASRIVSRFGELMEQRLEL